MMRKLAGFALTGMAIVLVVGCGSGATGPEPHPTPPAGQESATASAATATTTPTPAPTPTPAYPACKNIPEIVGAAGRTVTQPGADVPAAIAAFSGAWEGVWGTGAQASPSALVVLSITATRAQTNYLFRGSATPVVHQVVDGKLYMSGGGITFTWTLSPDGKTLTGVRTQGGGTATTVMERCAP